MESKPMSIIKPTRDELQDRIQELENEIETERTSTAKIIEEHEQEKDNLEARMRMLEDEIKDLKEEKIRDARKGAE